MHHGGWGICICGYSTRTDELWSVERDGCEENGIYLMKYPLLRIKCEDRIAEKPEYCDEGVFALMER